MSKRKKLIIIICIIAIALLTVFLCLNTYFTNKFSSQFYPNTSVNNTDISYMTLSDAESELSKATENYSLSFDTGKSTPEIINGSDFSYEFTGEKELESILSCQTNWIDGMLEAHSYKLKNYISYDKDKLSDKINSLSIFQNMQEPQDAYVDYKYGQFLIIPEQKGSLYDVDAFVKDVISDMSKKEYSLDDIKKYQILPSVTSTDRFLVNEARQKNSLISFDITYDLPDGSKLSFDKSGIASLIKKNDDGDYVIDSDGLSSLADQFMDKLRERLNSINEKNSSQNQDNTQKEASSDVKYELSADEEKAQLIDEINNKTVIEREPVYVKQ